MIINEYIKNFEKLGIGMFAHFGLYSILGSGEWTKNINKLPEEEYNNLIQKFNPAKTWAKHLVGTAKKAGCKYITLTARHHEGFSLFDTCGLSDFDVTHSKCGRDIIREFIEECNKQDIVPFLYMTLLDWREKSYNDNFKRYLEYLRKSVELLCTNYGKIGGIWFDGMWDKPNEDWEEDLLYKVIRRNQPDAMIINNTGLNARGALGNIELDSVTFERGKPLAINLDNAPKYVASEMCQTLCDHWGYAKNDFCYKSVSSLIEDLCSCRRYGSNFLLNAGLTASGAVQPLDKAIFEKIGRWVKINDEALRLPRPEISETSKEKDFILKNGKNYYLFCYNLPMVINPNVVLLQGGNFIDNFKFDKKIKKVNWLDDKTAVEFIQSGENVTIKSAPYVYGKNLVVRVAKIET